MGRATMYLAVQCMNDTHSSSASCDFHCVYVRLWCVCDPRDTVRFDAHKFFHPPDTRQCFLSFAPSLVHANRYSCSLISFLSCGFCLCSVSTSHPFHSYFLHFSPLVFRFCWKRNSLIRWCVQCSAAENLWFRMTCAWLGINYRLHKFNIYSHIVLCTLYTVHVYSVGGALVGRERVNSQHSCAMVSTLFFVVVHIHVLSTHWIFIECIYPECTSMRRSAYMKREHANTNEELKKKN